MKNSDVDPVEENLPRASALSLRRHIKSLAKEKVELDLDFCEYVFYSKVAFVEATGGTVPFYKYCGFDSWKEYVEQEIQITFGKAKKYAQVYSKYCVELESVFDRSKHSIDVTKLELLLPIVTKENLKAMIAKFKAADCEALKDLLAPSIPSTINSITYRISKKENPIVNKAMKLGRKEFGGDLTDAQIFVAIFSEYLENAKKLQQSA